MGILERFFVSRKEHAAVAPDILSALKELHRETQKVMDRLQDGQDCSEIFQALINSSVALEKADTEVNRKEKQ